MGLREQAEKDLGFILGDVAGFAWPITITDPSGAQASLTGVSDDIAQLIDPDTGQAVSGRLASIAIRIADLYSNDPPLGLPVGIADAGSKPWRVTFNDINGLAYTFKVSRSNPDRMLGEVTCILEAYE